MKLKKKNLLFSSRALCEKSLYVSFALAQSAFAVDGTWAGPSSVNPTFTYVSAGVYTASSTLAVGDAVRVTQSAAGLTNNRIYYVVAVSGSNYTLSATPGGSAITGGSAGTATSVGIATWDATAATNTQAGASWTGGVVPSGVGAIATIGNTVPAPVAIDSDVTIGTINFTSTNNELNLFSSNTGTNTTLAALNFATSSGTPTINVTGTKLMRLGLSDATFGQGKIKITGTQGLVLNITNGTGGGSMRVEDVDWSGFTNGSGGVGTVTIQQGPVQTTTSTSFGSGTSSLNLVIGNSSTNGSLALPELQLGNNQNISLNNLDGTSNGRISGGGRTLTIGAGNGTNTDFLGIIGQTSAGANSSITLTKTGTGTQTISGTIVSQGAGVNVNAGTLVLNGANTYTGQTAVASGATLKIGNATALGGAMTTNVTTTASSTSATVASATGLVIGQVITGTGIPAGTTITAISGTTITLSQAATAAGTVSGTFAGTTSITSGGTLDLNGQTSGETISAISGSGVGGLGALINSNTSTAAALTMDIASGTSFTVGGAGDITVPRIRSGGGPFTVTKIGAGTLTTNGSSHNNLAAWDIQAGKVVFANTSGLAADRGVTLNGGTLQLSGANSNLINDGQSFTINSGTFDMNGKAEAVASISGAGSKVTNSNAAAATLYVGGGISGTSTASYGGYIENGTGVLNLTKEGTGTQTLTGTNTYTGNTTIANGTLEIAGAGSLGSGNYAGAISNSGTLNYNTSTNQTLSGVITGTGALVKNNVDTLTLSGTSTYTGDTTVSAGTLFVTGTLGNTAVAVASGATLMGDGSIGGSVNINGGTLALGNGTTRGDLEVTGTVTLNSSSIMSLAISDAAGESLDQLKNTGLFSAGGSTLNVAFNDTSFNLGVDAASLATASRYTIVTGSYDLSNIFSNFTAMSAADMALLGLSGTQYEATFNGQRFWLESGSSLSLVPIPESSTSILALLSSLALLRRKR